MHSWSHAIPKARCGEEVGKKYMLWLGCLWSSKNQKAWLLNLTPLGLLPWPNRSCLRLYLGEITWKSYEVHQELPRNSWINPPQTKPRLYWISLQHTLPTPCTPIQTSASLSPVRATFYVHGPFRWDGCCVKFCAISFLSQKFPAYGSFATVFSGVVTSLFSQEILTGHICKAQCLSPAWYLPKDCWRTSLYCSFSCFAALKMLDHMFFCLGTLLKQQAALFNESQYLSTMTKRYTVTSEGSFAVMYHNLCFLTEGKPRQHCRNPGES